MNIAGLVVGILISAVVTGILIWIVSKIGLGLEVDGFGATRTTRMPGARLASRLTETQRTKHNDVAFRKKEVTDENHRPTAASPCSPAGCRLLRTGWAYAAAGHAGRDRSGAS